MKNKPVKLYVVLPCFNEEAVIAETTDRLLSLFKEMYNSELISDDSKIAFVDDGSTDQTWQIITTLAKKHNCITAVKLAHNAGHQNALLAGMFTFSKNCDCMITIDADLQDDIGAIPEMVMEFINGNDIVYGVRDDRRNDSFFKRNTALSFYRIMKLFGAEIVYNHADYRLMSHRAIEALQEFSEVNMFLRGVIPLVGFNSTTVYYKRGSRFAGESKYPLKKMISFALDGITSFSITPIRLITLIGAVAFIISVIMALYAFIQKISGNTSSGWASIMISIWFIGGAQLISLGLIGEYIGKIYKEVKKRPRYIIEEVITDDI